MSRRKTSRAIVAAVLASTPLLRAGTVTFNPSKDNTLFESGSGALGSGAGSGIFTGMTQSGLRRRGLFAFDLTSAGLPTNAQASSVTLSLYVDMAAGSPLPLELRRVLKNWGEGASNSDGIMGGGGGIPSQTGDATWLHTFYNTSFWTSPGGDYSAVLSASANLNVVSTTVIGSTAQMVSDVQGWLNNPATNFGWITVGNESTTGTAMRILSRTNADTANRPLLTLTYNTSAWKTAGGLWSSSANWNYGVPNAVGAEANFNFASGPTINVSVDGSTKTVGTLNFDSSTSYAIAGSTLALDRATAPVSINVKSGNHGISTPINFNKNADINVTSGSTLTLNGVLTLAGGVSIHKVGDGTLSALNIRGSGLTIDAGTVAFFPYGVAPGVSKVTSLTINAGKIDLADNHLITATPAGSWNGSAYTGVTGLVVSGKGSSNTWNGATGIVTTQTAAIGTNYTTLGVARALDVRPTTATATDLWAGQTITGTDTLVMYTYGGDANLDGKLNIDDYVKIDQGIASNLTGWSNGDFNYDGKVNIDDYSSIIDSNIGNQSGTFFTGSNTDDTVSAVPEPATALLIIPALLALRRSRRGHLESPRLRRGTSSHPRKV